MVGLPRMACGAAVSGIEGKEVGGVARAALFLGRPGVGRGLPRAQIATRGAL